MAFLKFGNDAETIVAEATTSDTNGLAILNDFLLAEGFTQEQVDGASTQQKADMFVTKLVDYVLERRNEHRRSADVSAAIIAARNEFAPADWN